MTSGRRRCFGSVRKLPSGRWQASYWHEGIRHVASTTFMAKADASAWLSTTESDIRRGAWVDPAHGRVSFAAWSEQYLEGALHKRLTTLTRDRDVVRVHLLRPLGGLELSDITPSHVQSVVAGMAKRLAPATVRTNYGVLRAILNAAVDVGYLLRSPCRGIKLPVQQRSEVRFLSPDELMKVADAVPAEYRALVLVSGVLGLRWSEIAGLRVGRLDLDAQRLAVLETLAEVEGKLSFADVKTRSGRRTLSVPDFLAAILRDHLTLRGCPGPDELVFVAPDGGPLRSTNFRNRVWYPAIKAAGLDGFTFHGLRHSAVGLLIAAGAPDYVMQVRMGHSSSRVTRDVYGHVLPATDGAVTLAVGALFATLESRAGGLTRS